MSVVKIVSVIVFYIKFGKRKQLGANEAVVENNLDSQSKHIQQ